ncbi:hypothetical protein J2736_001738 [Paenibacillus qinlingensis]|uniref:Uncharacterized protein n=1 Tax=Paenibacillus qinlingensis TaxID=1837343 RepID=A0ABU1NU11_9BACL|nr:hypothetical protein [Paenibacillus qinlingensis]
MEFDHKWINKVNKDAYLHQFAILKGKLAKRMYNRIFLDIT